MTDDLAADGDRVQCSINWPAYRCPIDDPHDTHICVRRRGHGGFCECVCHAKAKGSILREMLDDDPR